ncbi:hypothetical protein ADUPG1_005581, partial [Aduncisulcus paluster]
RPICVSDTVQRLFFRPIVEKFVQFAMAKHLIGGYQRGFLPGIDGCLLNIIETREWLAENRSRCAAAIDIADAYGSVPHEPLRKIIDATVSPDLRHIFQSCVESNIHFQGQTLHTKRGCAQGNGLSPILLNIYLDSIIPQNITRHIRAFADDIIVLGTNPTNLENRLKEVSEALEKGA